MPAAETLKLPGWYLNFSARFIKKETLFEQKNTKF
jgi:hypothetical protein